MKWFNSLLGKPSGEPADEAAAAGSVVGGMALPMGLRLGGAVAIDPLIFQGAGGALSFDAPVGNSAIEAYGRVDLGADAYLHRFYLYDDAWVQVKTTAGQVDELAYFVFHETKTPANADAFRTWTRSGSAIGAGCQLIENREFTRLWGDADAALWVPPVVFDEVVYKGRPAVREYGLTHYAMLYQREIASLDRMESLLISAEDYGPTEFCVVYSLGIGVTTADLEIT